MMIKRILSLLLAVSVVLSAAAQITPAPQRYVRCTALTDLGDGRYRTGEEAVVHLYATAGGAALGGGGIRFEAGDDRMEPDLTGTSAFADGHATIRFGTRTEPGFRYCTIHYTVEGETYTETVKVGFDIDRIEPTIANPMDFDYFWHRTLKEARRTPLTVERTPMPDLSNERVETSMVRIPCFGDGSCIYGYLSVPRDGAKHPVLLVPPGAGVKRIGPSTGYAEAGFVTLAIEVHGLPMNCPDEELKAAQERIGEYAYTGIASRDDYYYRRIYAGCVRAIDYLMTLPEFDGEHVGVTGGSQGGALSIVTAALHEKVGFVAAFYPALCDVSGYLNGRAGGWPRMFPDAASQPGIDRKKAMRTMCYYDVVNFARRVRCAGFYSYGFNDNTCPPTSVCAALNQIRGPKTVVVTPASFHWRFPETNRQATRWMQEQAGITR